MPQGTPIIDPSTNTAYFFSKGYKNGASNGGVANGLFKGGYSIGGFADYYLGIYKFFAIDVQTLKDRPGFPVLIDGSSADNDRAR